MTVSVLLSCLNRADQLRRSLWLLKRQTWFDYEIWVLDDGSTDDIESLCGSRLVNYVSVRPSGSRPRSPNMAWWAGYELCEGEFVILSHAEIMVPKDAITRMVVEHNAHRSVPIQYAIPPEQQRQIDSIDWKDDLDALQKFPNFWSVRGPWGFTNHGAHGWRHHFSFTGQFREEWDRWGFLPKTEVPGDDDSWMLEQETAKDILPNPIDLKVYHQYHERLELQDPEGSWEQARDTSARIKRIRQGEQNAATY